MNRETRAIHAEIRAPEDQPGVFEAVVMRYGVVDDYKTVFDPGCFKDSLEKRLPRITWAHDWSDVIGRYVDYRDTDETLTLIGQLDDFDAVPRARQAYAQLKSGTIDNFSVGFRRNKDGAYEHEDGFEHFRSLLLDESALVLAGAVPDTGLVAVRSIPFTHGRRVPENLVIELGKQVAEGTLTKPAALAALDLAAGGAVDLSGMAPVEEHEPEPPDLVAEAEAVVVLDGLGYG